MGRVAAVVLVAALLAPASASAEKEDPPVVVEPGVYVVSACSIVGRGRNEAEARRVFQRAAREARRAWGGLEARCSVVRLTDVVRLAPLQRPAFWVSYPTGEIAPSREQVIAECRRNAAKPQPPTDDKTDWVAKCGEEVFPAYGPFKRKRAWREYDDARAFVYLSEGGNWITDRGEPICFAAGTPVRTPDGDRPIEELAPGSPIVSWSAERGAPIDARVVAVKHRRAHAVLDVKLADGRALRMTANHPLWVPARAGWVPAGELRAGDAVAVLSGAALAPVAIAEIASSAADVDVYDLTVEPGHSYFAAGVLTHNY